MEIKFWMSAVLMGLLTLVTLGNAQGLSVSITTTPPSPPFQAATWIRFACQSTGFLVTYNWTVYCVHNQPPNQPMIVAHFTDNTNLGEISLSLRSTAKSCADTVVCTTRDFSGNTGQATWTLGTVTGVGFWGSALPIENNSALVADSLGQIGTLYCHSTSNVTNAGRWFSPDGSDITTNFADSFAVEFFSGDGYPSYSSIEVIGGHQFTASYQGAYSCTAPDNNGVDQTAVIWIYPHNYQGTLQFSFVGRTAISPLTLNCDTTGLPPTVVRWTKGSSTLLNGPVYQMLQTHTTNFRANYTNKLVINQPLHDADGIYSCTVINALHDPIQDRDVGATVSFVQLFFGVYSVGAETSVNCNFDDVSVVLIQWESPQGIVITRNYTLVFTANDSIHSLQFNCHGYNAFGLLVKELQFKIIVNVPDSTLVAMATRTEPNAILGREYSVTCLAAITANSHALLYSPVPSFNNENGTTISSGSNSVTVQGPVSISSSAREVELVFGLLKTSHAGRYVCRASLDSPALDETLIKEDIFQLNLQLPSPVLITLSPSHPSPYFAGSTVTLTCDAMASSLIDTYINAVFSWTRNGEVISDDNRVTITQATSTVTAYQSILTITQLNHDRDTGSYQCSASFEPVSSSFYLSSSLTEESASFSINIQVQSLLVSVNPTEVTVLDVSPHNVITISCLATDQDNTTVGTKSFAWSKQDTNTLMTTSLQHNGGSVSIINRYSEETISTSMLVTSETQAASYVYMCASTQMTLDNTTLLASGSTNVSVTVKGPTNPAQPSGLSAIVLGFSSARIEWTVPSISYTQETYSVAYGLNQQQLDSSSIAVTGSSDLNAVNQVYSTNLTGLEEGRTYYYRVQSMNTIGRVSQSDIDSFQVEDSQPMCPVGSYEEDLSTGENACVPCPDNSFSTMEGSRECSCFEGYFRTVLEEPNSPCTSSPSTCRQLQIVSERTRATTITVRWDRPEITGREDFYYNIFYSEDNQTFIQHNPRPYTKQDAVVDYTLSGLKTLNVYTIRVSVENGVSDQDKRRERNANSCETIGSTGDSRANAPSLVVGQCTIVVWTAPTRTYGRIIGYDVNFVLPGPEEDVMISKGSRELFHVIGDEIAPSNEMSTLVLVQVRAKTSSANGRWSELAPLGCAERPTCPP